MAHNARIRKDAAWVTGFSIDSSEFVILDTNLTKALNGDDGGAWTPTSNIVIGGAGMWFAGGSPSIGGASSSVVTSVSGNQHIVHADNDHIALSGTHTGNTRSIATDFDGGVFGGGWEDNQTYGAPQSTLVGANALTQLRVHHGATLTSVAFSFVVASSHLPTTLPQFRVFACGGGVKTPLRAGAQGYASFTPTPASGAAWFAAGAVQTFTYTPDATIVIDTSKYTYWAEVIEESGNNALPGNIFVDATCTFQLIADLRPQ